MNGGLINLYYGEINLKNHGRHKNEFNYLKKK